MIELTRAWLQVECGLSACVWLIRPTAHSFATITARALSLTKTPLAVQTRRVTFEARLRLSGPRLHSNAMQV